jgi:Ser/Thr protein kinase RdoA (MazF antagonist)
MINPTPYKEALDAFADPMQEYIVEPITEGLINHSYHVTNKVTGKTFLLQEINDHVFPKPAALEHNYEMLWKHLQAKESVFFIPAPYYFPGDSSLFCDSRNHYWRIFEFVPHTQTIHTTEDALQASTVAKCFAGFTASFEDFDTKQLNITLPGFHDLSLRFDQLQHAIHKGNFQRIQKAAVLLNEIRKRERYANLYDVMTSSEEFLQRVMHHDAKISNVLFDKKTDAVICPIDLDTVMPGYFFSDLGDMIRSMACCKDENSTDLAGICIRPDIYKAIVEAYLSIMDKHLTGAEKKYIHYAGLMMSYMQTLRFCADYLNGDVYYKIDYREQNFDRAMNQFTVLQQLEEFLQKDYKLLAASY